MTKSDGMFSKKMFRDPLIDRISFFLSEISNCTKGIWSVGQGFFGFL